MAVVLSKRRLRSLPSRARKGLSTWISTEPPAICCCMITLMSFFWSPLPSCLPRESRGMRLEAEPIYWPKRWRRYLKRRVVLTWLICQSIWLLLKVHFLLVCAVRNSFFLFLVCVEGWYVQKVIDAAWESSRKDGVWVTLWEACECYSFILWSLETATTSPLFTSSYKKDSGTLAYSLCLFPICYSLLIFIIGIFQNTTYHNNQRTDSFASVLSRPPFVAGKGTPLFST